MPRSSVTNALAGAANRIPALRRLPLLKLLALAEITVLVHDHVARLQPAERRRVVELVRRGRGRGRNLSDREREELAELISMAEPRLLLGEAAEKLSPVRLPGRVVRGRARNR